MSKRRNEGKEMRFDLFRYQIMPKSMHQFSLFGEMLSLEELKARKNGYFMNELLEIGKFTNSAGEELYHKFVYYGNEPLSERSLAFYLGPEKQVILQDRNFDDKLAETHPSILVVLDNDPAIQKMAISINKNAFSSPFVVVNILEVNLNRKLDRYGLQVAINPILDKKDFWDLIKRYEHRIEVLKFEIVKPNISNISSTLGEQLKGLINETNSQKTTVELAAPKGNALENINENNEALTQVAQYSVEGGASDVSMKIKGMKSTVQTKSTVRKTSIQEIEIKGSTENIGKALNRILGETR